MTDVAATGSGLPMSTNLQPFGATFRIWAPAVRTINVQDNFINWTDYALTRQAGGYWFAIYEVKRYFFMVDINPEEIFNVSQALMTCVILTACRSGEARSMR